MELIKEELTVSKTVCAGTAKTSANGDIIVPDTKADILRVVQVDAASSVSEAFIRDGRINVTGAVGLKILYIPESETEKISSITSSIDFSEQINCRGASEDMKLIVSSNVSRAEFSVINSRKLRIKNTVSIDYEVIAFENLSIANGTEEPAELKTEKLSLYNICDVCTHEFSLSESEELPSTQSAAAEQLKVSAKICDTEYKTVEGRIVMKGTLSVGILYLSEDGSIEHAEFENPFTEVADGDNIHDDLECDIDYEITDISCEISEDSDGDMRMIGIDADIRAQIKASADSEIEVIRDCYVPFKNTELEYEKLTAEETIDSVGTQNTIKSAVAFKSSAPKVAEVYDVVMKPRLTRVEAADKKIICEGKAEGYILYLSDSNENPVYSVRCEIPFSCAVDSDGCAPGMTAKVKAEIKHTGYTLNSAGDIEVRCVLDLHAHIVKKYEKEIVSGVSDTSDESESRRGIIIYFVQPGDSLWDIAKQYRVPQERILKFNDVESENVPSPGARLFIPNCWKSGGTIASVSVKNIELDIGTNIIEMPTDGTTAYMLWNSLEGMTPLCETAAY